MTLREELEDRADQLDAELLALFGRMKEVERQSSDVHTCLNALDIAEMDAEDAAQEWAEAERLPIPDEQPELFDDASEFAADDTQAPALADPPSELRSVPGTEEEVRDQFEEERERAAAIELTADVEPTQSGLHDAEGLRVSRPWSLITAFRDGFEGRKHIAPDHHVYMDEYDKGARSAGFEAPASEPMPEPDIDIPQPEWNEPQTEGYAPVVDNSEAHIQAVEAERYAQPTNPEADALARAHDYYDPKAVADRERNAGLAKLFSYNPFYKSKVDA